MPIEFRCVQCGKLLRTGDDTAGRQAQCPACGTLNTVPAAVGPGPAEARSYQSFQSRMPVVNYQNALRRVAGPAISLIVVSALGMLLQLIVMAFNVIMLAVPKPQPEFQFQGDLPAEIQASFGIVGAILGLALSVVMLIGAIKMVRLKSYGFSMAAAIIAMLPCIWPCCILGLPFGIWAIVVLVDPEVKAAFNSQDHTINC